MSPEEALTLGAGAVALIAALLAWRASSVVIRNSIDDFMGDLQRQGRWSNYAAVANAVAAIAIMVALGVGLYDSTRKPDPEAIPAAHARPLPTARVTAICRDNWESYSEHRSGTCAGHRGVREWVNRPER